MSAARAPHRHFADADLCVDVRSLGRRAGSMRPLRRTVRNHERIGLDLIAIPGEAEIELDLQLQAVSEGVLVTGTVTAATAGECVCCLEPFTGDIELSLTELFAYPSSVTDQTTDEDEIYRLEDDYLDLEPLIVDSAGLELPLRPMCTDDCPGLCPQCGIRMAIAESGHSHEILDPRWAALAALKVDTSPQEPAGPSGSGSDHVRTSNARTDNKEN